ncbi:MAG: phage major capsid protein [Clostridia bacterium]|nr:phage major capsid protein [Clostridia bacterium]
MVTISSADAALKTYYLDAVTAQLDSISPFYAAIDKHSENVYGKEVKLAVVRGNYGNVVAGGEDDDLPAAGGNRYLTLTAPLKNIYGTIEISDKAIRASRSSDGAFVDLLNAEVEGLVSCAKVNFSRMLFGDGNGYLAAITRVSGTTFTVDRVNAFYVGMVVDLYTSEEIVDEGVGMKVTAVDYANSQITVDNADSGAMAGLYLYLNGAYGKELTGMQALFFGDSVYGTDKSSDSYVQPTEFNIAGTITEEILMEKINYLEEFYNSRPNMILCSFTSRRGIAALLAQNRRQVDMTVIQGGYSAVLFDGIPVVADRYCPDDAIYLINTDDFGIYQLCDWEWMEDEDGKILKQVPGKAAYSATLVKYAELICSKPCGQGVITGFNF